MVLISLFLGCVPKTPPVQAPKAEELALVAVLDDADSSNAEGLPAVLQREIQLKIQAHNLSFKVVGSPTSTKTDQRLQKLSSEAPVLLIETKATYQSQLQGRFRWEVDCTMSLLDPQGQLLTRSFTTPVFHKFHHEREEESLLAAEPVILRQLEGLLEDYIRGM